MDFRIPRTVTEAISAKAEHGIFGYILYCFGVRVSYKLVLPQTWLEH
jgi:hypothetical protein